MEQDRLPQERKYSTADNLNCNTDCSWVSSQSADLIKFGAAGVQTWGSKITADGDCSHEIKRRLLLGRKVMTNLDSILKSRDITLPTKVRRSRLWFFQWSCIDVRVGL